jgi:hypothetical protein
MLCRHSFAQERLSGELAARNARVWGGAVFAGLICLPVLCRLLDAGARRLGLAQYCGSQGAPGGAYDR